MDRESYEKQMKYQAIQAQANHAPPKGWAGDKGWDGDTLAGPGRIGEPSVRAKALEALHYLETAHQQVESIHAALYGEEACAGEGRPEPMSLDGIAARTSELAAMLSSRLATLYSRL